MSIRVPMVTIKCDLHVLNVDGRSLSTTRGRFLLRVKESVRVNKSTGLSLSIVINLFIIHDKKKEEKEHGQEGLLK